MKRYNISFLSILLSVMLVFSSFTTNISAKEISGGYAVLNVNNAKTIILFTDGSVDTVRGIIVPGSLLSFDKVEEIDSYQVYFDTKLVLNVTLNGIGFVPPGSTSAGGSLNGYYTVDFTFSESRHAFITGLSADTVNEIQTEIVNSYSEGHDFTIEDISFIDTEKLASSSNDDNLCWAATCSNMLSYSGWGERNGFASTDDVFENYINCFNDGGYPIAEGLAWYVNGVSNMHEATADEASVIDPINSGNYQNDYAYDELIGTTFFTNNRTNAMSEMTEKLKSGYGIGLTVDWMNGSEIIGAHAITCWGYVINNDYDENSPEYYEAILFSDSDSDKYESYLDRRDAPNCLRLAHLDEYSYPPINSGIDSYILSEYSEGVLECFSWIIPYSDSLPKEPLEDGSTKDKRTTVDFRIDSLDILSQDGYYAEDSNFEFRQNGKLTINPILYNASNVDFAGEISCQVLLIDESNSIVFENSIVQDIDCPSFSSYYCDDEFIVQNLSIGQYTLTVKVNDDYGVSEAYYYNNQYNTKIRVTVDGPDISNIDLIHDVDDISAITFIPIRELYAGIDASVYTGIGAEVFFDDGSSFTYDYGYSYAYDETKKYGGGKFRTQANLSELLWNSFEFDDDGDLLSPGSINVSVNSEISEFEYNSEFNITVVDNPVQSLRCLETEDLILYPYEQDKYTISYYDEELDEMVYTDYYGYLKYIVDNIEVNYNNGNSTTLHSIVEQSLHYQSEFDGYSFLIYYGDSKYDQNSFVDNPRNIIEYISDQNEVTWLPGNRYPVTVRYMGHEVTYYIRIVNPDEFAEEIDCNEYVFIDPSSGSNICFYSFSADRDMNISMDSSVLDSAEIYMYDSNMISYHSVIDNDYSRIVIPVLEGNVYYLYVKPKDSVSYPFWFSISEYIASEDGLEYIINGDGTASLIGINDNTVEHIEIPEHITKHTIVSINDFAFYNNSIIKSVLIPSTISSIGYCAFSNCTNLETIIIEGEIEYIGSEAFDGTLWFDSLPDGCVYLGDILYSYKNKTNCPASISIDYGTITIASGAFAGCDDLTMLYIPNTVKFINDFSVQCKRIKEILLPNSIISIGYRAIGYYSEWDEETNDYAKSDDFTIYGIQNELARSYAEENNLFYQDVLEIKPPTPPILGDADCDGTITIIDATVIQRKLANLPVSSFSEKAADILGDGLDILDATHIQRYLASLSIVGNIGSNLNISHMISFDPNGGTLDTLKKEVSYGGKFGIMPVPKYNYHVFIGWYTKPSGGDLITEISVHSIDADIELHAHWIENDISDWVHESEVPSNATIECEKWIYDYTDYKTAESNSMPGYTLYDTRENGWNAYGSWSSWSTTKATKSDSRDVQTKTQYFYDRYRGVSGNLVATGPWEGTWSGIYCGTYQKKDWSDTKLNVWSTQTAGGTTFNLYGQKGDSWYNQKTRTMYRYRDRTRKYLYYFMKTETLESITPISESENISNVQHWVRYRVK